MQSNGQSLVVTGGKPMHTKVQKTLRSAALCLLLGVGVIHLAWAVIATYAQIVAAVNASPTANAFIKANADAVANLALRVENMSGDTTNYNGSCCSGILQMNAANIAAFAGVTPAVYRTLSLQQQVDAWTALTVSALGASSVSTLRSMTTFDGMPTDAYMQLSCIQLGIGNCQTMISSGHCEGWTDGNGTSICKMAAKMQGLTYTPGSGSGSTPPTPSSTSANNNSLFNPTPGHYAPTGSSVSAMLDASFTTGSGVSMGSVSTLIKTILASILVLFAIKSSIGAWSQYQTGQMDTFDLKHGGKRILILMMLMMLVFVY